MIVIVDGYNLIKQVLGCVRVSHAERDQFVSGLVQYFRKKKLSGVIVFDGGEYSYPYKTKQGDIEIIFSGYQEKADAIIMRYIDEHPSNELLIVSSDREIRQYAHARKKETIAAPEFYARYLQKKAQEPTVHAQTELHKLALDAPKELDELMREATQHMVNKDENAFGVDSKKRVSSAQQTSKKERKQQRVLRKL